MKFLARRTDRIITISQSEKKRITESRFAPESRIDFIYHGVNPKFKPKDLQDQTRLQDITSPYALPDRFLLYVGRLNKRKNLSNLLRAIGLLKDRQIKLVLAGTPWGRMFNLEGMIMELGLADRVIVTGFVPDEDLPALYSRATVFCYVSFDEGFGLPPLEAMASGLPVVLADTAVLREVCGGAGNYADPKRPEDIAGQIDGLLENQDLYEEKKNAGLEWARRFRWSDSAERLMKILDCLLEGG
jgi:glycosyltransferase involved in cell wall biosynthesis